VKSNVTQLVERLEADGLAVRAPDPADRRSRLAAITDAGRRAYDEGVRVLRVAENDLLGVLTPDEVSELARLVGKLDRRCG
jgi:DNA-binding MarR family transcriptional regulator